ncbi:MAG: acetyl-CoA carboxylase biotin carboxyl carrier protein [Bacillota bacterium]
MKRLRLTDTTLRDGHQSLWATRMRTKDMLPIIEKIDNVGYYSLEVWGGATFDVCLRYLGEDPWDRLRVLRKRVKNTKLQMLLRGQSLVGYQHYPDDVVRSFIDKAVHNGMDIIRVFDALNDLRNMQIPIEAIKKAGAHAQGTVVYTISPVHTVEHYLDTALKLQEIGADSICLKDMAGLLSPHNAFELVKLFKERLEIPIQLHSHYIGGLAVGAYLEAASAGVDVVDTASVPLAFGASQPPVETIVRALSNTDHDTGLDLDLLFEIAHYFDELRKELGYERGVTRITDMQVFGHQVPGGMITNLVSQLKEQNSLPRLNEVLAEIPRVRKELGYPPLVTPTSQIVGTQAVLNVITGERYKLVPGEVKAYLKGAYGRPPGEVDLEIRGRIIKEGEVCYQRPADKLEPRLERARQELKGIVETEEDVLSYCLFPQVAMKFFEDRRSGLLDSMKAEKGVNKEVFGKDSERGGKIKMDLKEINDLIKTLEISGMSEFNLETGEIKLLIKKYSNEDVNQKLLDKSFSENINMGVKNEQRQEVASKHHVLKSPMVGTFYKAPNPDENPFVKIGDLVKPGQTICIVEAMKLMNEVEADVSGYIVDVLVKNGEMVEYGQELFLIEEV